MALKESDARHWKDRGRVRWVAILLVLMVRAVGLLNWQTTPLSRVKKNLCEDHQHKNQERRLLRESRIYPDYSFRPVGHIGIVYMDSAPWESMIYLRRIKGQRSILLKVCLICKPPTTRLPQPWLFMIFETQNLLLLFPEAGTNSGFLFLSFCFASF